MLKKGMVIKIKEKYVIVATDDSDFIRISKKDGLVIGQKIYFDEMDIVQLTHSNSNPNYWTGRTYASVLAACLIMLAIFINPFNIGEISVYAVVSLDVNPSFELEIDNNLKVLSIRALNNDGINIVDQSLVGLNLDDAVKETIIDVKESGIAITKDSGILISTVIVDKEDQDQKSNMVVEKEIVDGLDKAFEQVPSIEKSKVVIVEADEKDLENAQDENLSVGKYKLIQMSEVEDSEELLKSESIGELIKREDIIDDFVDNKNNLIIEGEDIHKISDLTDEEVTESIVDGEHWLDEYEIDDDVYDEFEEEYIEEDELDDEEAEDELDDDEEEAEDELDDDEEAEDELDDEEAAEDELDDEEEAEDELDDEEEAEDELDDEEEAEDELDDEEAAEDELDDEEAAEDELDDEEAAEDELDDEEAAEDELDEEEEVEDELDDEEEAEDEEEADENDHEAESNEDDYDE